MPQAVNTQVPAPGGKFAPRQPAATPGGKTQPPRVRSGGGKGVAQPSGKMPARNPGRQGAMNRVAALYAQPRYTTQSAHQAQQPGGKVTPAVQPTRPSIMTGPSARPGFNGSIF